MLHISLPIKHDITDTDFDGHGLGLSQIRRTSRRSVSQPVPHPAPSEAQEISDGFRVCDRERLAPRDPRRTCPGPVFQRPPLPPRFPCPLPPPLPRIPLPASPRPRPFPLPRAAPPPPRGDPSNRNSVGCCQESRRSIGSSEQREKPCRVPRKSKGVPAKVNLDVRKEDGMRGRGKVGGGLPLHPGGQLGQRFGQRMRSAEADLMPLTSYVPLSPTPPYTTTQGETSTLGVGNRTRPCQSIADRPGGRARGLHGHTLPASQRTELHGTARTTVLQGEELSSNTPPNVFAISFVLPTLAAWGTAVPLRTHL